MDYRDWIEFFGRPADHPDLFSVLKDTGVGETPVVARDETDVRIDVGDSGITLIFTDEAFFYLRDDMAMGEQPPILTGVIMMLRHPKEPLYTGPLPFGIERGDSKDALRRRFGTPVKENERFRWDQWRVDDLLLLATYVKDLSALARVSIMLPGANDSNQ